MGSPGQDALSLKATRSTAPIWCGALTGLSGKGVKVGVISDGAAAWSTARATGDLPSSIEINPNLPGDGHEGTALLEIVHDLAPEAELAFSGAGPARGSFTSLGMVKAILWLANDAFSGEGADVIVDDLAFFKEPYFEDGMVARAAADAVAGGAVLSRLQETLQIDTTKAILLTAATDCTSLTAAAIRLCGCMAPAGLYKSTCNGMTDLAALATTTTYTSALPIEG